MDFNIVQIFAIVVLGLSFTISLIIPLGHQCFVECEDQRRKSEAETRERQQRQDQERLQHQVEEERRRTQERERQREQEWRRREQAEQWKRHGQEQERKRQDYARQQHRAQDRAAFSKWKERRPQGEERRHITVFPDPPARPCLEPSCTREALTWCTHSLERLYCACDDEYVKVLREERTYWHPDRFAPFNTQSRVNIERKTTMLFQIIENLLEREVDTF